MASENHIYEEIKMPDHHRIFPSNRLLAGDSDDYGLDIYGTSTSLNILIKDGKLEEAKFLEDKIHEKSEEIRNILTQIFEIDDSYSDLPDNEYLNMTLFSKHQVCKSDFKFQILLPFTVSKDTFNTCYPVYNELIRSHLNYEDRFEVEINKEYSNINNLLGNIPYKIVTYNKACVDVIKGIKQYIKMFLSNDDFLINSYKFMYSLFEPKHELYNRLEQSVYKDYFIEKYCIPILNNIRSLYKIRYHFEEEVISSIKYKIIPKDFLFYRA